MNKKIIIFIAIFVSICIGTATTCVILSKAGEKSKSDEIKAEANVLMNDEKGEPAGGYFEFYGEKYPVYDPEQWTMINNETQQFKMMGKELLNKLGVLTKSQLNCTIEDVKECLAKLDKNAHQKEIIHELNKVAGCFDYVTGSGITYFVYNLSDGNSFQVIFGDCVEFDGKTVFMPGYGYNENGWDN